jgi:tetratricopeptide (TPR) repeat protein
LIASGTLRGGDLAQSYVWRGITCIRFKGDWDRAIADFTEALRLGSKDPGAYAGRAAAYVRKGDFDRALPDLNEGVRLDPKHAGIRNVLGYYYNNKKGDYERGLTEVNESLRLAPQYAYAFNTRGEIYENKGEYNHALADFRTALTGDPNKTQRLGVESAEAIARIEGKLAACAHFRVALSFDPDKKQVGGREAAEGIARVEQKLAKAGGTKVAVAAPGISSTAVAPVSPRSAIASRSSSAMPSIDTPRSYPIRRITPPTSRKP